MKIKQLKRQLLKAGFSRLPRRGKGSHSIWQHQQLNFKVVQSGHNGKDAKPYQLTTSAFPSVLKRRGVARQSG